MDEFKVMQQCGTEGKESKMNPSPGCETPTATRLQGTAMKSPPFLLRHRAQHRGPNQDTSLDPGHQSRGLLGSLWELSACHCPAPGWSSSPPALLEKGCSCPSPAGTGAWGAPLTRSLPSEEHTGSSRAPPAGLASALTATFAPSLSHPCPSVPSRQPRTVPARRHLWSQCRTGAQSPIHLSWGAKRD